MGNNASGSAVRPVLRGMTGSGGVVGACERLAHSDMTGRGRPRSMIDC